MKWIISSAFLMVLYAVIQVGEGNDTPYHPKAQKGNQQGPSVTTTISMATRPTMTRFFNINNVQQTPPSRPFKAISSYEGGLAKPLNAFLHKTRGHTFRRDYSKYSTKPHWNFLVKSAMENFGQTKRGYPLYPRNRGALSDVEKSQSYQTVSRFCIDSRPAPYSMQSLICSGVIDFGISALIEGQILQDLLTCVAAGQLTGNNLTCLGWLLARMYAPGILPWPLKSPRFFSLMRRGMP